MNHVQADPTKLQYYMNDKLGHGETISHSRTINDWRLPNGSIPPWAGLPIPSSARKAPTSDSSSPNANSSPPGLLQFTSSPLTTRPDRRLGTVGRPIVISGEADANQGVDTSLPTPNVCISTNKQQLLVTPYSSQGIEGATRSDVTSSWMGPIGLRDQLQQNCEPRLPPQIILGGTATPARPKKRQKVNKPCEGRALQRKADVVALALGPDEEAEPVRRPKRVMTSEDRQSFTETRRLNACIRCRMQRLEVCWPPSLPPCCDHGMLRTA